MFRRTLAVVVAAVCASAIRLSAQCPGTPASPQSPSGNVAANTAITFNWTLSPTSGITGYDVLVSHNGGNPNVACSAANTATSCTNNSGFSAGGNYAWAVRTKFSSCNLDSSPKSFSVGCPATPPTNQTPADNSTNVSTTPTLTWTAVPGATAYEIFLGVANTAGSGCSGQPVATSNTNSFTPPPLQPGTTYEWKVEAIAPSNFCPGVFSTCLKFTTAGNACAPAGSFSPISPANGDTVTTDKPTLQWSPSSGADKYFIHLGVANPPVPQVSDPLISASSTSYTVNQSLSAGTYYWYVDAIPACGSTGKTSSPVFKFTVAVCPTAATTPQSPANNATNVASPVTFQWNGVNNGSASASAYSLYVNDNLVTTTTDTKATAVVPSNSTVTWYVDTLYRNCAAARSQKFSFHTAAPASCATGSIALLTPANGATISGDNKVNFSWTGINGASAYRLFVSIDGSAPAQLTRTTDTSASISLPNGSVEWYVEALFPAITTGDCPSVVSPHGKFTIAKAANCDVHKAATPSSPISGNATSPVTFTWAVTDQTTTLYRVWASINGAAFGDLGVTTNNHLTSQVGPGTVVWYVQSFFEGCPSLNSTNATFNAVSTTPRCPTGTPTLILPQNNSTVAAPVTFTWTAVAGVDDYRLYASKDNGDFALLGDDLDETTVTRNLPPGVYTWFVEATFEECSSNYSIRSKFTVNQGSNCPVAGPQLLAPADGATGVFSPVTLDWSDVANAVGYVVIIEHNDGSATRLDDTIASETTKHLAPGTYEWWVLALFNGCPPVESAHRTFIVPNDPCNTKRPLLLLPPDNSELVSPARFAWTRSEGVTAYKVWASVNGSAFSVIGTTADHTLTTPVPPGRIRWFVETATTALACSPVISSLNSFVVLTEAPPCDTPERPIATAVGQVASGTPYSVRWTPIPNSVHYELEESATADFSNATTQVVSDTSAEFTHTATAAVARYFYRVRAVSSCSDVHGPYSKVVPVFVIPAQRLTSVEFGSSAKATQSVKLPGQNPPTTFSAHADKPWVTVSPTSGNIGPDGVTLTLTSDPVTLNLGTNTATLLVTYGASGKTANAVSSGSVPVSINLVTPVSPTGKNTPIPESLIIPAVAHAQGANSSMFQSDVRIANVSATTQKYLLNFTLSGTDGTQSGQSTTIQIDPGTQMALDDILTSFFGNGADGSGAAGMLEIRPLSSSSSSVQSSSGTVSVQTVASSKTYNVTSNGTFGQYIPAIPFAQFIAKAASGGATPFISLQQIAQSPAYRTNFGLVEGSGQPADVLVHVFDNAGHEQAQIPISLLPGEHKQINSFLAVNNLTLTDGRIEVEVVSSTGKVSAYASVVDNLTNDPLLVFPVLKGGATSTRYTIPGVADLNNGFASWRSDLRIFNPGLTAQDVTLTYYPQGGATPPEPKVINVNGGEVYAIDNALQTLYGLTNSGGAIAVTTASSSALTVTARTYNQTSSGTYGQFIPAIAPSQSVGKGDRTLQILQLESSSAYRTNLGLVETTGNPVTIELSVVPEDSKVAAKLTLDLAANEFRQISLADFGFGTMYNTRVAVKVTNGSGKVTAYGSVIDQITQDPTYVVGQ